MAATAGRPAGCSRTAHPRRGGADRPACRTRTERPPRPRGAEVAALAVCAAGLLGFCAVLWGPQGRMRGLDEAVPLGLRTPGAPQDPVGPAWLEIAARDLTALGGTPVLALAGLVALGHLLDERRWRSAPLLTVTLPGGLAPNTLLKRGFDRPRPDLVAHLVEVQTAGFPSSHATLSAIVFLTVGALLAGGAGRPARHRRYVLGVAALLAGLVGASRVYLGVHWPTDVLAGWCLGAAWAVGCWPLLRIAWPAQDRRTGGAAVPAGLPPPRRAGDERSPGRPPETVPRRASALAARAEA